MCNRYTPYPLPITMHSIEVNFISTFPFTGTEVMHLIFNVLNIMISGIIQCATEGVHFSNPLIHKSSWTTQQKPTKSVQCLIFVIHLSFNNHPYISYMFVSIITIHLIYIFVSRMLKFYHILRNIFVFV